MKGEDRKATPYTWDTWEVMVRKADTLHLGHLGGEGRGQKGDTLHLGHLGGDGQKGDTLHLGHLGGEGSGQKEEEKVNRFR